MGTMRRRTAVGRRRRSKIRTAGVVLARSRESDHQAAWFNWARSTLIRDYPGRTLADFSYAVPNGMMLAGGPAQRGRLMNSMKAQGLKVGVSDIVIALPRGPYHGAYMELKRDSASAITDAQENWTALMNEVGYNAGIVIGLDAAIAFARAYLNS